MALKLNNRTFYPPAFVGFTVLIITGSLLFPGSFTPSILISLVGAIAALFYFLYRQHLDETKLFKDLFVEFNARYDKLNEELNIISEPSNRRLEPPELSPQERSTLSNYFNLCAEEWLFYQAGYIDERVWQSWLHGMAFFATDSRVFARWKEELRQNSYYEFPLEDVEKLVSKNVPLCEPADFPHEV